MMKLIRRTGAVALAALLSGAAIGGAQAAGETIYIDKREWSFAGIFGYYDDAQLQRGFKVYREVCASCHGMKFMSFRNLASPYGPNFSDEQVKALAAEYTVPGLPDEFGDPTERPAIPADRWPSPYPNEQAARAANAGAYPPDLSLITKARNAKQETAFAPAQWATDIVTGYQEGGADYMHALLTGYVEELPEGVEFKDGLYYNKYYPGNWIGMPQPLYDELVEYTDGTPMTVDQYSRDVSAFLMWAAEPTLEQRKQLGLRVMLYLVILAALLYLAKRRIWSRLEH